MDRSTPQPGAPAGALRGRAGRVDGEFVGACRHFGPAKRQVASSCPIGDRVVQQHLAVRRRTPSLSAGAQGLQSGHSPSGQRLAALLRARARPGLRGIHGGAQSGWDPAAALLAPRGPMRAVRHRSHRRADLCRCHGSGARRGVRRTPAGDYDLDARIEALDELIARLRRRQPQPPPPPREVGRWDDKAANVPLDKHLWEISESLGVTAMAVAGTLRIVGAASRLYRRHRQRSRGNASAA